MSQSQINERDLRKASEVDIRRLARYCGIEKWDTLPVPLLIDELGWKGIVSCSWPKGCY